jgi:hypothetical protein
MPVINGVYLKDFAALPSAVVDANIIPIAITGNQIAYRTTVGGIVTDARVTSKLLTGLSVTGGAVVATDTILQAFGKVQNQINSKVSSVGLTMPSAFNVANSPITSSGTLAVTAIGAASQYIRGDGALADFPTTGGGGSSVAYYLNGSVSQGTIGGNAYYEMNKTPVIGTGTDFTIGADGYIAQFITDANDPASLLIPAGNWNVEMYFSASSSGGTPSFYVEVYKYNGTTFTLLGSSATTPEGITNGTAIDIYYTSVGIPETVLTITDRLAIRIYVDTSGRTITLHTEDNHLSEIVTTFSNGLTALNGLTKQAQYFAVGSTGTDFNISSSVDTHTFNIPSASASNRGLITTGTQTFAGAKTLTGALTGATATFTNSGSGIGVGVTNSGSGDGIKITHSLGRAFNIQSSSTGYGIIINNETASTSVPFTIQKQGSTVITMTDAGGATFGGAVGVTGQLTLGSTITNGTYTYTLPSATGTLALTSALSGYLPLTGGTLTGALSGTSATFNTSGSAVAGIQVNSTNATSYASTLFYGTTVISANSSFDFLGMYANSVAKFRVDGNGALFAGAATFSSSVTSNAEHAFYFQRLSGIPSDLYSWSSDSTAAYLYNHTKSKVLIYALEDGNVGIGETNPTSKLTISAPDSTNSWNSTNPLVTISNLDQNGTEGNTLLVRGGALSTSSYIINAQDYSGNSKFYVRGDGNVGIGTVTPNSYGSRSSLSVNGTNGGIITLQVAGTKVTEIYAASGGLTQFTTTGSFAFSGGAVAISNGASNKLTLSDGSSQNGMTWEAVGGANSFYLFNGTISSAGWGLYNVTTGNFPIFATNGSNVIIGSTTDAGYKLDVNGTGRFSGNLSVSSGNQLRLFQSNNGNFSYLQSITNGDFVVSTGGTANALIIANNGAATFYSTVTATGFFESSSIKGKDIIKTNPLTNLNIDVIKYTRKTDESKDVRYGYSAEQIHSLMPELTDKDVTAVKYLDVHTLLIAQLQQEIKELKAKLN